MRGFTLIEAMICCAILAILLGVPSPAWLGLVTLQKESDYRHAARNANQQLQTLRTASFEALPPQLLRPDKLGWVRCSQRDLIGETVRLKVFGNPKEVRVLEADWLDGRFRVDPGWAGQTLWVDYEFYLSDKDEAHEVGADGRVILENSPVKRVEAVWHAQGPKLTPITNYRHGGDVLHVDLPPKSVVVVDYRGGRVVNRVSGTFLNAELLRIESPSALKLMQLRESYAERQSFAVTCLRVKP